MWSGYRRIRAIRGATVNDLLFLQVGQTGGLDQGHRLVRLHLAPYLRGKP